MTRLPYNTLLLAPLLLMAAPAHAIVMRHDVDEAQYRARPSDFPPLATFYRVGAHGTLIHPEWVLTAAHAVFCLEPGQSIRVGDEWVEVESRHSHRGYRLDGPHDLALVKLARPVRSVMPASVYTAQDEQGQVLDFIGVGGSGNGLKGQALQRSDGQLRRAQNRVRSVDAGDLLFRFDRGAEAEPLEGVSGNGDSGGPAYRARAEGGYWLVGVSSRTDSWWHAVGEYGVTERYTRVSAYQDWVHRVMTGTPSEVEAISTTAAIWPNGLSNPEPAAICPALRIR